MGIDESSTYASSQGPSHNMAGVLLIGQRMGKCKARFMDVSSKRMMKLGATVEALHSLSRQQISDLVSGYRVLNVMTEESRIKS